MRASREFRIIFRVGDGFYRAGRKVYDDYKEALAAFWDNPNSKHMQSRLVRGSGERGPWKVKWEGA